jgi:hypothetical protein
MIEQGEVEISDRVFFPFPYGFTSVDSGDNIYAMFL